jgi:hypothetical protein
MKLQNSPEIKRMDQILDLYGELGCHLIDKIKEWPWREPYESTCIAEQIIAIKLGMGMEPILLQRLKRRPT